MTSLFDPLVLGAVTAKNRVLMAPMTRARATRDHVPTPIMTEYYRQRASAGLIISEGTGVSKQGLGWPYAPGLWSEEQVAAWRPITAAVHEAGGLVFAQLWHMGRTSHSGVNGLQPVSASVTTAPDHAYTYEGPEPFEEARALELSEIPGVIEEHVTAARNAIAAGFDGVQLHGANGYLVDQFLRDGSNHRTDEYGGSIENRVRLLREITQALADAIGADRVAVRLSPNGDSQGVDDSNPEALFTAVAKALSEIGIAFLELREPGPDGTFGATEVPRQSPTIREHFAAPLILNSDYDLARAQRDLQSGLADGISFGRPFVSNPDLPHCFRAGVAITEADMNTLYSQGEEGYVDYPAVSRSV
jgi:2,4-dienoyl-CoA reductase-like NADH-dependent reductase (Old Yellow Enzyme family)